MKTHTSLRAAGLPAQARHSLLLLLWKQLLLQGNTASRTTHSWTSTSRRPRSKPSGHPASSQTAFVHYLALTNPCRQASPGLQRRPHTGNPCQVREQQSPVSENQAHPAH